MTRNYLIKEKKVKLIYDPGKGAWTYHIKIPNTKHIIGKWGSLKVSGFVDNYKIESKNLFTIKGQDKLLSINETIRKTINKGGGDSVTVTLYLITQNKELTKKEIRETLRESDVLAQFDKLPSAEQNAIFSEIISHKSEEQQVKILIKWIETLSK